jgi:hypothetical protein
VCEIKDELALRSTHTIQYKIDSLFFITILAASAARGASPQKHVYVRYMSTMYVLNILYVQPNGMAVLCLVVDLRFSDIHTAHQQTAMYISLFGTEVPTQ